MVQEKISMFRKFLRANVIQFSRMYNSEQKLKVKGKKKV